VTGPDGDASAAGPNPDATAPAPEVLRVLCWRCGLPIDATAVCPHCRASVGPPAESAGRDVRRAAPGMHSVLKVILAFSGMLGVSLIWGWILFFGPRHSEEFIENGTVALEIVDTVLSLAVWAWVGRVRVPRAPMRLRVFTWLAAPLALLMVMAVNIGYRMLVEQYLHGGRLKEIDDVPAWSVLNVLLFTVQPAVVEEFFFRHLAYGAVRAVTGLHAAVWVSAVMFAVAHIYNPLGLPWLLVAGVVFGYCRAGGGLALPMLMHFAHNLVMTWYWST
jgi:membrane protease YdiL (CAAX protease family)